MSSRFLFHHVEFPAFCRFLLVIPRFPAIIWAEDAGHKTQDTRRKTQDARYKTQDTRCKIQEERGKRTSEKTGKTKNAKRTFAENIARREING